MGKRLIWAMGLRKLMAKAARAGQRQEVLAIRELLRHPDGVDLVGAYVEERNVGWRELGDGQLLGRFKEVMEWFLENGDELLAFIMKLVAVFAEENEALVTVADVSPVPGVGVVAWLLVALVAFVSLAASPASAAVIERHAVMGRGEIVTDFASPIATEVQLHGLDNPQTHHSVSNSVAFGQSGFGVGVTVRRDRIVPRPVQECPGGICPAPRRVAPPVSRPTHPPRRAVRLWR